MYHSYILVSLYFQGSESARGVDEQLEQLLVVSAVEWAGAMKINRKTDDSTSLKKVTDSSRNIYPGGGKSKKSNCLNILVLL